MNRMENKPANAPLESYAKHQTNVFNALRQSVKKEGDMFLFGEPTDKMMKLLLKLYHENVIRNIAASEPDSLISKLKCMFGVMQDNKGNLYVTISESPGVPKSVNKATDSDYMKKRSLVLNLLKSAKVTVAFPEKDDEQFLGIPVFLDEERWRKGPGGGDNWDTLPQNTYIREKIKSNSDLKQAILYNDDDSDNINIYDARLRDLPMKVNYIDSVEYLMRRFEKKPTFPPYKRYKLNESTRQKWMAECNNGHLCTESKLFGYAAIHEIPFDKGSFVAYWIGSGLPPEGHIFPKYCYRTEGTNADIPSERVKLDRLTARCKAVLRMDPMPSDTVMKNTVQPMAIACPGCFANIKAYLTGNFKEWNQSNCYVSRTAARGGYRKKTQKMKKRKQQTRRLKHRA